MNEQWPAEIEELLAVYALDAVDDDERAVVEDYLRDNPRALAEVESYREALSYLDAGAPAPAGLWERIAAELETAPPPLRLDAFRPRIDGSPPPPPTRSHWQSWPRVLAVAAASVAVVGAGAVIAHQQREIDRGGNESVAAATRREALEAQHDPRARTVVMHDSSGALTVAAYVEPDGDLFLEGEQLPALDGDRTYQLWCVPDAGPSAVSLAVLGAEPTTTKLHLDSCSGLLAVTDEVEGGVAQSSNEPVVAGRDV